MSELYKVTFNIDQTYGYIAYDEANKEITVTYPDEKMSATILNWLQQEHTINTPDENGTVHDFSSKTYLAKNSKKDFQTVLTRIWEELDVHIDWSFPPECI